MEDKDSKSEGGSFPSCFSKLKGPPTGSTNERRSDDMKQMRRLGVNTRPFTISSKGEVNIKQNKTKQTQTTGSQMKDWESEQPLLSSRRRRETGLSGQKTPGGAASTPDLCSQTPSSREPQKVQLPARSLGQWKELLPQTRSQPRQTLAWKPGNTISHLVQQLGQSQDHWLSWSRGGGTRMRLPGRRSLPRSPSGEVP